MSVFSVYGLVECRGAGIKDVLGCRGFRSLGCNVEGFI